MNKQAYNVVDPESQGWKDTTKGEKIKARSPALWADSLSSKPSGKPNVHGSLIYALLEWDFAPF